MMQDLNRAAGYILDQAAAVNGKADESGTEKVEFRRNSTSARDSTRNGTAAGQPTLTAASF